MDFGYSLANVLVLVVSSIIPWTVCIVNSFHCDNMIALFATTFPLFRLASQLHPKDSYPSINTRPYFFSISITFFIILCLDLAFVIDFESRLQSSISNCKSQAFHEACHIPFYSIDGKCDCDSISYTRKFQPILKYF